jgi:3-hydroxyisobutyrate dehydrogenase
LASSGGGYHRRAVNDSRPTSVAVLGTGIMGAPIARRLAAAGFEVTVWNRTRGRAASLADGVAAVAETAAAATAGADLILTVLADGPAVRAVMEGPDGGLAGADDGAIWIQSSTVGIEATRELEGLAAEGGLAFVDAPVLGTREPAEEGKLIVLGSGPAEARAAVEPAFEVIAQRTVWLGEAGRGSRMKLVLNAWTLALTAGLAEAITLAERLEVDPAAFLDVIKGGPMGPPYAELKGRAMIERSFDDVAFPLKHAEKDTGLVLDAADGLELELLSAARADFRRALEGGHGDEDMAAVYHAAAR